MENPYINPPTYSVVMPIYLRTPEQLETAKKCYDTVRAFSKDFEYIIVDNGSTMDTSYFKGDVNVRYSSNRGISGAWNTGLRLSRAPYIAVINDDIEVADGWLDKMRSAVDMPMGGVSNVYVQHLPQGVGIKENYKWFSGSCYMLKKSTVLRVGYFDERIWPCNWEDVDYWIRLLRSGLKMYVDYSMTIKHKEGETVHAKDLSSHFMKNKEYVVAKHGFDPTQVFYGNEPFPMR